MLYFIATSAFGQDLKQVEIETNKILELNADASWEIVQDWKNLNKLVPKIVESTSVNGRGLHSTWDIHLTNGGLIKEKMVYFDSAMKTMSYIMTETPIPIEDYTATIKVEPYGVSKSMISFYTSCKTNTKNLETISKNFKSFQETYLSNIEKQNYE